MMRQTGGEWSAPLDDVFIHFDYARAVSEGHPLEWLSGQGISTGNTSLTYPIVLALGLLLGFEQSRLLVFAAWLACMCVFGIALLGPRLMRACFSESYAAAAAWFFPPALVSVGVLCWSLWSGMEVAFFLALWAGALAAFLARRRGLLIAFCIFLVATRPEAIGVVLSFALFWEPDPVFPSRQRTIPWQLWRQRWLQERAAIFFPALGFLVGQAWFNRITTGEWTQNGALVKLALYNPYYNAEAKIDDYWFNLKFATFWNIETHITDVPVYGYALVALALLALLANETRALAGLLLSTLVSWTIIVALNGQIRWQNQRYTTPAIAWLLCMATLGFAVMVRGSRMRMWSRRHAAPSFAIGLLIAHGVATALRPPSEPPSVRLSLLASLAIAGLFTIVIAQPWVQRSTAILLAAVFALHQAPKRQEQAWFFGRACRNIRDQQVSLGRWLGELGPTRDPMQPMPRVLVGDAGAILYESRWRGLDMIGLGGLYGLPFARAYQQGLGASVELIERLPNSERPQLLAIFPSWWEHLPLWFGGAILRTFPAEGNVICGDYAHVVYQADWHLLGTGEKLSALPGRTREVRDALDVGDLVSERAHGYMPSQNGHIGVSIMRILPANAGGSDMWDGGREIEPGHSETFDLSNGVVGIEADLVIRTAPQGESHVHVFVNDTHVTKTSFAEAKDGEAHFVERPVHLPALTQPSLRVRIENDGPQTFTNFHVYLAQ